MHAFKVFVVDGGHLIAHQLTQILVTCTEPHFEIRSLLADVADPFSLLRALSDVPRDQQALSLIAFDHLPPDSVLVPFLAALQSGNSAVTIVATKVESAHDVAHILDLGATDVLLAPLQTQETIGRVCHWLDMQLPQEKTPRTDATTVDERVEEDASTGIVVGLGPETGATTK